MALIWVWLALLAAVFVAAGAAGVQAASQTAAKKMDRRQFYGQFQMAWEIAHSKGYTRAVPFEIAYSVAAHECAYGAGRGAQEKNALFSIHTGAGDGRQNQFWRGDSYTTQSGERLRGYFNWSDAIADFCLYLSTRPVMRESYAAALSGDFGKFAAVFPAAYLGTDAGSGSVRSYMAALLRHRQGIGELA